MNDVINRKIAIGSILSVGHIAELSDGDAVIRVSAVYYVLRNLPAAQPEQRWIPCGKCIHADGKHRWCKVLDRTINEDYFYYWAEPWKEGEA